MNKKISLIILSIVVFCFAIGASAMTSSERQTLISQLQAQISSLTNQIIALRAEEQGASSWCHTFNNSLGYSNSGTDEVVNLHLALQQEGISYGTDDISTYTIETAKAVGIFQERYGIGKTGYVGVLTRAELNKLYGCESVTITTNEENPNVFCAEDWTCGSWSTCVNGTQARTCTDKNSCGTTTNKPTLSQSCAVNCSSNCSGKSCGADDGCGGKCQTGTCPTSGMTCSNGRCVCSSWTNASWSCTDWSNCVNDQQTRVCRLPTGSCYKASTVKPTEIQSCTSTDTSSDTITPSNAECVTDWSCTDWGTCIETESQCYQYINDTYKRLSTTACKVGFQTRTCTDLNNCSPANRTCGTPLTQRYCKPVDTLMSVSKYYSEQNSSTPSEVTLNSTTAYKGKGINISWSSNDTSINTFYIILQKSGKDFFLIVEKVKISSGSYNYGWTTPYNTPDGNVIADGSDYSVKITDIYGRVVAKSSNFTIASSDSDDNYIKLLSPNGGEVFENGKTYTIRWDTNIKDSKLYIFFRNFDSDNIEYDIVRSALDTYENSDTTPENVPLGASSYSFTVPQPKKRPYSPNWQPGNRYKILIMAFGPDKTTHTDDVYDISDGFFSVNNGTCPIPKIAFTESLSSSIAAEFSLNNFSASLLDGIKDQLASIAETIKGILVK